MPPSDPHLFVIFGATGVLTKRLILPALYDLTRTESGVKMRILGTSRAELDDASFRDEAARGMADVGGVDPAAARAWANEHLFFQTLDNDPTLDDYERVKHRADSLADEHDLGANRVLYLALPPGAFGPTAEMLGAVGMNRTEHGWTRLVVEKPFGHDLATAQALNATLHAHFDEAQVYRIDHYLGKETVQNLLVFRLGNPIFERLWNRDHIERVDIVVSEALDVATRGAYYDTAGALRDMVQNHLTQLFTLVAMEVPSTPDAGSIRAEKVKVLRATAPLQSRDVVLGQYTDGMIGERQVTGYLQTKGVAPESHTETYAALRLEVNNWRWQGVPFVLQTGKAMEKRLTEVRVTFREAPVAFFRQQNGCRLRPNVLHMQLAPDEGFSLGFEVKRPGDGYLVQTQHLHFDYGKAFGEPPTAYRTLMEDLVRGDQTLFVHADEVEAAWSLYDPILRRKRKVHPYAPGTWGPVEAVRLTRVESLETC